MKKSWKPQVRSFILNQYWFYCFIIIILCATSYFFLIDTGFYTGFCVFCLILLAGILLKVSLERLIWKAKGYEKITIDSENKCICFDDKDTILFDDIKSIKMTQKSANPTTPFLFRDSAKDYGIHIFKVNKVLLLELKNNNVIEFAIQNRFAANSICNFIKNECKLDITNEKENFVSFK